MYILGLSCFYHDSAAAIIRDGVLIAAAEEERFSRVKHDYSYPSRAIEFCLQKAGIKSADLDYVVFYEKPLVKFERILQTSLATFPRSWRAFGEAMITWLDQKLWIKSLITRQISIPAEKVLFIEHHLAHAASAFFCSPFEEAAILTIDGVGEWTTATLGRGRASWVNGNLNDITLTHEQRFPHSLGLLYSAFTAFLGFEVNEGEYKVMGMSPYGSPQYVEKIYDKFVSVFEDGSFRLNMDYFSFHYSTDSPFNKRFVEILGEPRKPESPFITALTNPGEIELNHPVAKQNQYYADVAASIQRVTEEIVLKMATHLYHETGLKQLCFAGGVALNSLANGRLVRETPFENVFINPAPGDAGGAIGAALYVYHVLLHYPRQFILEHAFWGQEYSNREIENTLKRVGARYECFDNDDTLLDRVVESLVEGKVIGWFDGRFEWGPRALGHRSILADPRRAEMKDIVNAKIKFREPFRPFAPVILEERTSEFFDGLTNVQALYPLRYMLLVLPWRNGAGDLVPAVNHMGTGRLQVLRREWNPRYYELISKFGQLTGVPVLMNTSFNLRGEPIVNSPSDAWKTFSRSGIDLLVLGKYLILKDSTN